MKTKIQIKSIFGEVLFEFEKENNTAKNTVEEAVSKKINLGGADLRGANLGGANLCDANLRGADLCDAYLRGADLRGANLGGANLCDANLGGADLGGANLCDAYLRGADLCDAYLRVAYLRGANLCGANLRGANLRGADLCDAYLRGADLCDATNIPYLPLACPSDGAFIGWKKVNGKLVQLEIQADAKRSSATTRKCRCSKAMVISITNIDGSNEVDEVLNTSQESKCLYKVGQLVIADSFDEDRFNECSHGIHFFINKEDAINYLT